MCSAAGSLSNYDAAINSDAGAGTIPVARLNTAVTLTGANGVPFNFGTNSGDVTIEFILQGNPNTGIGSAYLAVGTNTVSNLRYEQYNNTGQLGFTQLGVLDYLFSPAVPSPIAATHIAYVWNDTTRAMKLYLNGSLAGNSSGVTARFAMPYGQGWLGANPGAGETMVGTIHRITVYDNSLADETIQRHADAFNDIVRPPILVSFTATPDTLFTPASATLSWTVLQADRIFIDGTDLSGAANMSVSPIATTTYTLLATNGGGSVTGRVTIVVNPAPAILTFKATPNYVGAGQTVALQWTVRYGETFSIAPGLGDVTALTLNGTGSVEVHPVSGTTYSLTAVNAFGAQSATTEAVVVQPAAHPVISEFMAENDSTLADEDGDYSDWIEVLNPTATSIDLAGYYLTDDQSDPTRWPFPSVILAPGAQRLIFASGKNRVNPAAPLHANFQLDKAGEYLALVGPGPTVLQAFAPFPRQSAGVSYGVLGGDPTIQRYLGSPTPGAPNDDAPPPPGAVRFSQASGAFVTPFQVTLSNDPPEGEIRFTLDGSVPGRTNGLYYTGPIAVNSTTRIRAAAVGSGRTGVVTSETYLKLANDLANYTSTLPILVIDNFGAGIIPNKGWSGDGSGVKQLPRQSAVWATFERQGGSSALTNQPQMFSNISIRSRGAFSSTWRQKPYSVEAAGGDESELDVSPLGLPAHSEWVLYFPDPDDNKDPTLFFNTFAYALSAQTGHYAVRFRWVEAFVNEDGGELRLADRRGVYALMEKVSRGRNRLDFQRLSADCTNGSWLLNLNRMDPEPETGWPAPNGATQPWFFHTAGPNRIAESPPNGQVRGDDEPQQANGYLNFENPNGYTISTNQRVAIEAWFKQFEDVLWNNALWRDPLNGYRKYLDPVDFADYFVLHNLTRNGDGLLISMFPWKGDDGKLRMGPAWDFNWSAYYISGGPTGTLLHRPDRLWYRRLFADPDFAQLYIDRWWDHRRGAMSNAGMDAIIDAQVSDIGTNKAVLNGLPNSSSWLARVTQMKTWLKDRANWIDGNYVRPPIFNQDGGDVPDGFQVSIYGTNGVIYYTTDGLDPRAPGGALAPSAQTFQLPFVLAAQTLVQSRIRVGTNWSAITRALFHPPQDLSGLALTEIMYNPPAAGALSGDEFEFIELKNTAPTPVHLGSFAFTAGISFTFTNGTQLGPGQFFVLARNPGALQTRYPGLVVNGTYSGRLDNAGETVQLSSPNGGVVWSVTYNDRAPWPLAADGHGFSLIPRQPLAHPNSDNGAHWRASSLAGGSPGTDDPEPTLPPVVVNEVLTRTTPPQVDWIELFNPTDAEADLSGWFLSDDGGAPIKYRLPQGTTLPPRSYRVFTEEQFNAQPLLVTSFSLDSMGDAVYLSSGDAATNLTGYSHGFSFGAAANGVSFGRYVNSVGEEQFPAQLSVTPGAANSVPRVGPVVIQEIHYHPGLGGDEFIELGNVTENEVPLFDPAFPTNTWRVNGLSFHFPPGLVLPAGGRLLIVGIDPAAFRGKYNVAPAVQVLGPFPGGLQDSGERLELQRPDTPEANGVPYVTVDEVRYNDKAPWPAGADGSGPSLQRLLPAAYGNDPANWQAALPTPGENFTPADQPPVITMHPQSQAVLASETATFTVLASGTPPLQFQWLFNNDPIPGASNVTLILAHIQPTQAGDYKAVVFNQAGSAVSAPARLTVNRQPTILTQPTNFLVRPGGLAIFTVSAVGNGLLRYQWRLNGTNLLGATNAVLSIPNVQLTQAGSYAVVVTDAIGPITSAPAELIVLITPMIVQPPLSQTVAAGASLTLSVVVTNTANLPLGYLWRTNGRFWTTNFLYHHTNFLHLTNVQRPFTNYAVAVVNIAAPGGLLSAAAILNIIADSDGDGLPDEWEAAHDLGINDPADALLDADGDTMSNRAEYIAGTDPLDPLSYLRLDSRVDSGQVTLSLAARAYKTYTIEFTDALDSAAWSRLADIPARDVDHIESIVDSTYVTNRFYRVTTPRRP